jgi:hypothetical protein
MQYDSTIVCVLRGQITPTVGVPKFWEPPSNGPNAPHTASQPVSSISTFSSILSRSVVFDAHPEDAEIPGKGSSSSSQAGLSFLQPCPVLPECLQLLLLLELWPMAPPLQDAHANMPGVLHDPACFLAVSSACSPSLGPCLDLFLLLLERLHPLLLFLMGGCWPGREERKGRPGGRLGEWLPLTR